MWRHGFDAAGGARRQELVQLAGDSAKLQRQVPLDHSGVMAREPCNHILSERTSGEQRRLHRDRISHIRRVGGRVDKNRPSIGVGRFVIRFFDVQRP